MSAQNDIYLYLKKHWGYDSFRPLQEEIITSIIQSKDTLALLPTGGGKSICFQIPALVIGGTCVVISPLIALMNDQVSNLKKKGLSAVAITSSMNSREIDIALDNAALGHVQFLYVSPERIESEVFRQKLSYLPVGLIAVDEAHCISQWGYDFRPSYLKIAELREYFPSVNIIAVTASATDEVVEDIQNKLSFKTKNVFKQSFERKNIRYVVQKEENKFNKALKIIKNIGGSGIIYVRNRKRTEEICKWLIQNNISALFYHAGIQSSERMTIQQKWIDNQSQVIVATNAFGMGIDKPDVRFVIHFDLPESLEAYFQEAGRAGRDEKAAYAVMLWNDADVHSLEEQFIQKTPTIDDIKQSYQAIFNYFQIPVESGEGVSVTFDLDEITRNYNLKPLTLFNSIKCLEKEGYLSYIDNNYEPSKVMVVMNKEDLYSFQLKYSKYESIIKVLLRSYGGIFEQYCYVKEKDIAFRSKISENETINQLNILHQHGVISFIPQSTLPKLIFIYNRINLKFDSLKLIHYPVIKEKTLARLKSVTRYVTESNICRSKLLLGYFGESNFTNCGYCDVCVEEHKKYLNNHEQLIGAILQSITDKPCNINELIERFSKFNSTQVNEVVNYLIDNDFVNIDDKKNVTAKNNRTNF